LLDRFILIWIKNNDVNTYINIDNYINHDVENNNTKLKVMIMNKKHW
jgi:hypothetical protein